MKKRIIAALLAVITIAALFVFPITISAQEIEEANQNVQNEYEKYLSENMVLVFTSDDPEIEGTGDGVLELWLEEITGIMAIRNKITGEIVFTNPINAREMHGDTKKLNYYTADHGKRISQLSVNFFQISSGISAISTMYSFNDCLGVDIESENRIKQYKYIITEDGLRVEYSLGEVDKKFAVPLKIKISKLREALLANGVYNEIKGDSKNVDTFINDHFNLYDAYDENFQPQYREDTIAKFPETKDPANAFAYLNPNIYSSRDEMKELELKLKAANPDYFVVAQTDEDEKTQLDIDMAELWKDNDRDSDRGNFPLKSYTKIDLAVDYNLTSTGLEVVLDTDSIKYDTEKYCLTSIEILPYFGASSLYTDISLSDGVDSTMIDSGYIFIPDGSGAIASFRDLENRGSIGSLTLPLYGSDYAYYQIANKNSEIATMPVFGLVNETNLLSKQNNSSATGFFAIIEDGDALASVTSKIDNHYGSAYATFKFREYDVYDIEDLFNSAATATKQITVVSDKHYDGKYQIEYFLLSDNEKAKAQGFYGASYVEMAKLYREYLGEAFGTDENGEKVFKKITEPKNENVTLFLEAFGSIKTKDSFLTFPVTVDRELTTFEDILNIQEELSHAQKLGNNKIVDGIENISFILNGFYNGGLSNTYPTKVKFQRVLGGKKGVNELINEAKNSDEFDVILDVNFSYSQGSKLFGGYSDKKNAVRTLDNRYTTKRAYYAATQTFERTSGVAVSTASFETLYNKFAKAISGYDFSALATRALGSDLNSDFNKDGYTSRQDALNQTVAFLKTIGKDYDDILLDTGNAYAIGYASSVLNAPLDSSKYEKTTQAVPFYGIVYHASIEFAGGAVNMEGDRDYIFLKSIENGAALYYTIAKQNTSALKLDPEYSKYYSVQYDLLKEEILEFYDKYNALMKDKQTQYIVDHRFVNDGSKADWFTDEKDTTWSVCYQDGTSIGNSLVTYVEYEMGDGFFLNYTNEVVIIKAENASKTIEFKISPMGYYLNSAN